MPDITSIHQSRLRGYFDALTQEWGKRPSIVTFEIERDKEMRLYCEVAFVNVTSLTATFQFQTAVVDRADAEPFAQWLSEQGYLRQAITADSTRLHLAYAAPESEVGDWLGELILIPREDVIDA